MSDLILKPNGSLCDHRRFAPPPRLSRREALLRGAGGLAGFALHWLAADEARAASHGAAAWDTLPKQPHFAPRAKNVIFLYMGGGPSQMDLLDPKPMLAKYDGRPIPFAINQRSIGGATRVMASPFKFRQHGQSGTEVSELLPGLSEVVDHLAVVRSGVTTRIDHGEAELMFHSGRPLSGFPTMGSWISYGLGSENQNMPAYVAMPDAQAERVRCAMSVGWLPAMYQGTPLNISGPPMFDLQRPTNISAADQADYLDLTQKLNRRHQARRPEFSELDARIRNFELAARLQCEALQRVDLAGESEATRRLYGLDNEKTKKFGAQCLVARRLVEAGVRFVHLIRFDWDHHGNLRNNLIRSTGETDRPVAALLKDLRQRGLLETTLVIWAGEFGRMPVVEGADGRDHNPHGFTFWMAGGGVKGGTVHGATDEFGYAAIEKKVTVADFHATVLHLLGLDHKRVTYPYDGRDESLTGVEPANVVQEILA